MKKLIAKIDLLVWVIIFACFFITEYTVEKVYNDDRYYQTQWWPIIVGSLLAAIAVHVINVMVSGQDYFQKPRDKQVTNLFFIHLKFWPLILPVIGTTFGVYIYFSNM